MSNASPAAGTHDYEYMKKPPSTPWRGGTMAALLWAMALYLLGYTLLDIGWQQKIGSWNYVILLGFVGVLAVIMRGFRPDMRRYADSKGEGGANDPLNRR